LTSISGKYRMDGLSGYAVHRKAGTAAAPPNRSDVAGSEASRRVAEAEPARERKPRV
jgi:hypothetical protein